MSRVVSDNDGPAGARIGRETTSAHFTETHWSQIVLAGRGNPDESMKAKELLCARYWPAIYTFLRRKGHEHHNAEDFTQQFFVRLLASDAFSNADRTKGRFRSFLLGALKHFLVDEARKASSQKRGGRLIVTPIELAAAEEWSLQEPDPNLTAEEAYDRRWAATILHLAFQRLRADFVAADQLDRFEVLKSFLSEEAGPGSYDRVGRELRMTPKAIGVAVSRLRQRYRQLVRREVADTLVDPEQTDQELRELFG
jgi:RNA polymerase sigma factor (sigma-70 family)